jgi:hypothetical protein
LDEKDTLLRIGSSLARRDDVAMRHHVDDEYHAGGSASFTTSTPPRPLVLCLTCRSLFQFCFASSLRYGDVVAFFLFKVDV